MSVTTASVQVFVNGNINYFDASQKAFDALFREQYQPLCRFAYSLLDSVELAEEVVADVFIKIWKHKENLQIQTSLKAYLMASVRNRSIDYLRKQLRHQTESDEEIKELAANYSSPEEHTISAELEQIIESAIDQLPPQGRIIFRMSRDQGLRYQEIADQMQISIKTVETHMVRSLKTLRENLGKKRLD
jgi:RNA polymerase sigma-70 factor (ECF subfamily)